MSISHDKLNNTPAVGPTGLFVTNSTSGNANENGTAAGDRMALAECLASVKVSGEDISITGTCFEDSESVDYGTVADAVAAEESGVDVHIHGISLGSSEDEKSLVL